MKKQFNFQLIAVFGGGLLFNFLFWNEQLALNLLIYSLFIFLTLFMDATTPKSKKMLWVAASHLLSALLVLYNHSSLTLIAYYISLLVFIGFAHTQQLRSIFTALLASSLQLLTGPLNLIKKLNTVKLGTFQLKPILKPIKYIVIPIIVLLIFSITYSIANPVFARYLAKVISNIEQALTTIYTFIFGDLSFLRVMHLILGVLFTSGMIIKFKNDSLEKAELPLKENMIRKRRDLKKTTFGYEFSSIFAGKLIKRTMALKTENTIAIISLAGLNMLLLSLNLIDITTLWMGDLGSLNFAQALHGSTNALILSIIMAMLVILYFFNGNLNFYSKNKIIRLLAYGWIMQNTFLILSVLLRDYHYITMHGLTYKRIGVIVFSVLSFIGLLTVYLKVAEKKTFFYLFKTNGLIGYILLLLSGTINWDAFIVQYNIDNRNRVTLDVNYLMSLTDKTLPQLIEHKELLKKYLSPNTSSYNYVGNVVESPPNSSSRSKQIVDSLEIKKQIKLSLSQTFEHNLERRIARFQEKQEKNTWLSWNYRDWQTNNYLNQLNHK